MEEVDFALADLLGGVEDVFFDEDDGGEGPNLTPRVEEAGCADEG